MVPAALMGDGEYTLSTSKIVDREGWLEPGHLIAEGDRSEYIATTLRDLEARPKAEHHDAVLAVQEALVHVHNQQSALRSALEQGAHIVFD